MENEETYQDRTAKLQFNWIPKWNSIKLSIVQLTVTHHVKMIKVWQHKWNNQKFIFIFGDRVACVAQQLHINFDLFFLHYGSHIMCYALQWPQYKLNCFAIFLAIYVCQFHIPKLNAQCNLHRKKNTETECSVYDTFNLNVCVYWIVVLAPA